jgi:uncharacterized membrane protein YgcG
MKKLLIITMIICLFPLCSLGDEADHYKSAGEIAGNMTQDQERARIMTEEMVQCMNAGVGEGDMQRIAISIQARTRDMSPDAAHAYSMAALGAAKQIARAGADSGSCTKVVRNALRQKYNAKGLGQLGTTFSAQVKNAGSATELANSFANAIKNGAGADNVGAMAGNDSGGSMGQGSTSSGSRNSGSSGSSGGFGSSGGSGSKSRGGGGR